MLCYGNCATTLLIAGLYVHLSVKRPLKLLNFRQFDIDSFCEQHETDK